MASRTSLRRFCQNVPLPQLVQGSYLTIRSGSIRQQLQQLQQQPMIENSEISSSSSSSSLLMNVPIHVIIEPSWRDHGHVEFRQYFRTVTDFVVPPPPPPPPPLIDTSPLNEINDTTSNTTTTTTTTTSSSSSNCSNNNTTTNHRLNNKIQMMVQPNHPLQPSKDRNAMVPHVTIDLQVPPQPLSSLIIPPPTPLNSHQGTATSHTFHQSMVTLPKNSLHQELDEENAPMWIEEIVEHEDENQNDHETDHGPSSITNEVNNNNHHHLDHGSDSYVVLTIQVPEKLNLTCELLHHNNIDNNHLPDPNHSPVVHPMHHHNHPRSSITIRNKIEGDVTIQNTNGDICVTKLRGHEIHLQNTNGIIYASNLLEAQRLTVQCTNTDVGNDNCSNNSRCRLRAKQIHASHVDITIDQRQQQQQQQQQQQPLNSTDDVVIMDQDDDEGSLVDISSMFISGSNGGAIITVHGRENDNKNTDVENKIPKQQRRRAVRIKSHHGPIQVTTTNVMKPTETNPMTEQYYPIVELGGVNGSCEVSIDNADVPSDGDNDEWSSCMVHIDSLAPDSVSLVTANIGHIDVTVDRKAEADLRLASLSNAECINEVGALLAEEDNHHHIVNILKNLYSANDSTTVNRAPNSTERIVIQTSAFTNRPENALSSNMVSYVDGWVENKSSEPDSRFERKNRGHEGVGKIRLDGAHTQALNSFTGGGSKDDINSDQNDNTLRPLLAVVGTNEIRVETVSWLGAIARRYGLEESGRELGRTASRKGRTLSEPMQ